MGFAIVGNADFGWGKVVVVVDTGASKPQAYCIFWIQVVEQIPGAVPFQAGISCRL